MFFAALVLCYLRYIIQLTPFSECFPSTLKRKAVLKLLRFGECFEKLSSRDALLRTVGLTEKKAAFTNFSGVMWTKP